MNKDIKVKDYKQKPKGVCLAQTEVDRELQPKITTSCPACSNTFVMCRTCLCYTLYLDFCRGLIKFDLFFVDKK